MADKQAASPASKCKQQARNELGNVLANARYGFFPCNELNSSRFSYGRVFMEKSVVVRLHHGTALMCRDHHLVPAGEDRVTTC